MSKVQFRSVLFLVALSTTICLAQSEQQTRSVVMDLILPNGATPEVRGADGGMASVDMPDVGKFGFVPHIQAGGTTVVVDVYNLKTTPHERLARIEASVGGDMVQTNTTPQFGIQIVRIMTP